MAIDGVRSFVLCIELSLHTLLFSFCCCVRLPLHTLCADDVIPVFVKYLLELPISECGQFTDRRKCLNDVRLRMNRHSERPTRVYCFVFYVLICVCVDGGRWLTLIIFQIPNIIIFINYWVIMFLFLCRHID